MKNLFLTGKVGCGKTTLLKSLLERTNTSIGGFMTYRELTGKDKTFRIISLFDGREEYTIGHISMNEESRSIKVFQDSFNSGAVSILEKSLKGRDIIVLDELGFMESKCIEFQNEINKLLASDKIVLGVLKKHSNDFLNSIKNRDDVRIIEVTEENRDNLLNELTDIVKEFGCPIKKDRPFYWDSKSTHWYNQALSYSKCNYPDVFIKEIKKYVSCIKGKTILDIGAGTGAFAIPLSKDGAYLTALDPSINMLASLKENAASNCINSINYVLSPFENEIISKHDMAISAFSGIGKSSKEELSKIYSLIKEYIFIISQVKNEKPNFNGELLTKRLGRPVHNHTKTSEDTLSYIKELNYDYEYKEIDYNFPQYFINFQDAIDFFKCHYNLQTEYEFDAAKDFLKEYLVKADSGYVFPNFKKSGLIVIKK